MPAAVAGFEFLAGIGADRVPPESLLGQTKTLNELAPVHSAEEAQAADIVGRGHLACGLLLAVGFDDLIGRKALVRQLVLNPAENDLERRTAPLQLAGEFLDKRGAHRRLRPGGVRRDV